MPALDRHAGGALICTIHLTYKFYTNHGPGSWTLQEKENGVKRQPAHGPPLQARVVAANRTVRTTCASILAHMEMNRGQSKMNGGKNVEEGSGHGMTKVERQANKAGKTRPLQANTAGGRSDRHRPRSKTTASRCWPASRRAVQVGGGSTVVLATQEVGSDLPTCLPPTYRLCLSLSLPTPLICKSQFSPNLFFCYFYFYPFTSPL